MTGGLLGAAVGGPIGSAIGGTMNGIKRKNGKEHTSIMMGALFMLILREVDNMASQFLIVNGMQFPCPMPGMEIVSTQAVSSGRNTNGAFVGDLVGRRIWKINNLQWGGLDAETWTAMKAAIEPFTIPVTFTGDDNVRRTLYMYPGDTSSRPLFLDDIFYRNYETCKFNLIDCGW